MRNSSTLPFLMHLNQSLIQESSNSFQYNPNPHIPVVSPTADPIDSIYIDNLTSIIIELCVLGLTIIIIFLIKFLKERMQNQRQAKMYDFNHCDDFRRLQSADSNQSSENFTPIKSSLDKSGLDDILIQENKVMKRNKLNPDTDFSKGSDFSV